MEKRLQELEARIEKLEAAVFFADSTAVAEPLHATGPEPAAAADGSDPVRPGSASHLHFASLIGRLFIGLAGAFLLRAAVDDGLLQPALGFGLGLAYAAGWLVWADRCRHVAGSRRGLVHGLLAALIAFPLLLESGVTRGFVAPVVALTAAGAITAALVVVAVRLDRQFLVVIATLGSLGVGTSIYFGTPAKTASCLLLLAVVALMVEARGRKGWEAPAWLAAAWTNSLLILPLIRFFRTSTGAPDPAAGYPSAEMFALLVTGQLVYFVARFSRRMLAEPEGWGVFEMIQTLAAMMLAFAALLAAVAGVGGRALVVGCIALAVGAALYAFSFLGVQRSHGKGAEFYYHSTLALLLVLVGAAFLPSGGAIGALWLVLALVLSVVGARRNRLTLRFHGAAVTLTAILAADLFPVAFPALGAGDRLPLLDPPALGATFLVFVCGGVLASVRLPADAEWPRRLPTAVVFAASAILGAGLTAQTALSILGEAAAEPGVAALVRTLAGCLSAIVLMLVVHRRRMPEAGWLVFPLLFAIGLKLVLEDLSVGSSGIRFVGFLVYGGAWIAAARTVRFARSDAGAPGPAGRPDAMRLGVTSGRSDPGS